MPLTGAKDHKLRFPEFCIGIHGRVVGKVGVLGKMIGGEAQGVADYVFRSGISNPDCE